MEFQNGDFDGAEGVPWAITKLHDLQKFNANEIRVKRQSSAADVAALQHKDSTSTRDFADDGS
ncbi:hypothetical protein BDR03DRAFT_956789 [Suillus americanus]|nr:hypothetical protein BDR03DRAFT_956789 [Suillus americanus]